MGILDDKRYEELDWVSKAVEPLEHKLSGMLVSIPDEIIIDYDTFVKIMGDSYYLSLDVSTVLRWLQRTGVIGSSSYEEDNKLQKCFELQVDNGTRIDFDNKTMIGEIRLIKTKFSFEDQDLKHLMGVNGLQYYSQHINRHDTNTSRCAEVMDILGANKDEEDFYKTRSARRKTIYISNRLGRLMRDNEWNIRNMDIADKVGKWVADYINEGNLAAFTNLCKLKVMTHKGLPIYSMEEEE